MILPATESTVWILAVVALLCLGSWANTLKLAGKWRFEHFYYDFVVGILLTAIAAAFLFGSAHSQELTFQDNLLLTGYRKMAWVVASGFIFNLGTLLLLAATVVSGMSVGFPVTLGVALVITTVWDFAIADRANAALTFSGASIVLGAVVVTALAYSWRLQAQQRAAQAALQPDPRVKAKRPKSTGPGVAIALAVSGGIVLSLFPRMVSMGASGDDSLAPYSAFLLFAVGTLVSAPFFVLFFTTFPVMAATVTMRGYLNGTKKQHLLGVAGGVLWGTGMLSSLLLLRAPQNAQPGELMQYPLGHMLSNAALLIAALWGLAVWREFAGVGQRVRLFVAGMLLLFLAGSAVVIFGFGPK